MSVSSRAFGAILPLKFEHRTQAPEMDRPRVLSNIRLGYSFLPVDLSLLSVLNIQVQSSRNRRTKVSHPPHVSHPANHRLETATGQSGSQALSLISGEISATEASVAFVVHILVGHLTLIAAST